jgi:hypothetical protein
MRDWDVNTFVNAVQFGDVSWKRECGSLQLG